MKLICILYNKMEENLILRSNVPLCTLKENNGNTSQKPFPIHKFWLIYSKIAPDGYRVSPIGDGVGKFWIHRLLVHVLTSLLPARFARRMIPCPFLLRRDEGHFSGLECWNRQAGFRYISQAATSSYVELYGKKIYPNLLIDLNHESHTTQANTRQKRPSGTQSWSKSLV
jgi:hypothetical protein